MNTKLKPEVKTAWVHELTHGGHKQCTGTLRNRVGEMCCLGVLAIKVLKLPVQDGYVSAFWRDADGNPLGYEDGGGSDSDAYLGYSPLYEAFIDPAAARMADDEGGRVLSQLYVLNDSHGTTFAEIAEVIERDY